MLLSSKRCPHTGVINFYTDSDPLLSIGCIAKCGTSVAIADGFTWRCYAGSAETSGHAPDLRTAERRLANFFAMIEQKPVRPLRH